MASTSMDVSPIQSPKSLYTIDEGNEQDSSTTSDYATLKENHRIVAANLREVSRQLNPGKVTSGAPKDLNKLCQQTLHAVVNAFAAAKRITSTPEQKQKQEIREANNRLALACNASRYRLE